MFVTGPLNFKNYCFDRFLEFTYNLLNLKLFLGLKISFDMERNLVGGQYIFNYFFDFEKWLADKFLKEQKLLV